jgi:probable HAF family extracellular repeat protein
MRPLTTISISALTVFAALATAPELFAQDDHSSHQVYRLSEIGTFGGPLSDYAPGPAFSLEPNYFNIRGATVGLAESTMPDPFSPNCFVFSTACYASYAFVFRDGSLTNLGALPGSSESAAFGINNSGLVVGLSETGSIDPATGYPAYDAVVWRDGAIRDLGTLGGAVSQAFAVNEYGQVVGVAANDVPDKYAASLGPFTTWNWPEANQQRAFLWQGGALRDLGTLGGDDAAAYLINRFGQVAGISYTNTTPNATTGLPTQDPFLWDPINGSNRLLFQLYLDSS